MELVYLWVEKYKNIKKQGFEFSPKYDYPFDGTNLTINPKKHIENLFGNKINITAIVGENGSGKSNILKSLFHNSDNESAGDKYWYILNTNNELKIYFIDYQGIYENKNIQINHTYNIDSLKETSTIQKQLNFSMIYFSNVLHYLPVHDNKQNKSFYNISISYLIDRYVKKLQSEEFIEFKYQYNYYKSKMIEQTLIMLKNSNLQLDFELPKELNIVIQSTYPLDNFKKMQQLLSEDNKPCFRLSVKKNIIYNYLFDYLEEEELQRLLDDKDKKTIENFYEYIKTRIPFDDELDNFLDLLENPSSIMTNIEIKDIDQNFIEKLKAFNKIQSISLGILDVLDFNWKPELSSGEENFLFQFASFYKILENANNLKEDITILIDEGETTMHPNWQKKYIKYYIDFFESNFKDKNIHIILTSHSPFILSDLPKENVIFLKKDNETGRCINDTKNTNMKPFGANIHTLLSDGFFMDGGLMGEFAKSKITEILKYLNCDEDLKTIKPSQVKSIIESIGEDFLRLKLLTSYNKKFVKDKKQLLKDSIQKLQDELNELD